MTEPHDACRRYARHAITAQNFPDAPGRDIFISAWRGPHAVPGKTVFIEHGRNGCADSPFMIPVIEAYCEAGYNVFAVDAANSRWNDAGGDSVDFTMEEHINDLRRAILWACKNGALLGWDGGGFALAGHSMGSHAAARLAAEPAFRADVTHVLMISPVISGAILLETRKTHPGGLDAVRQEARHALQEWPQNDLFDHLETLTAPLAVIVGEDDTVTPAATATGFYSRLQNPAGFMIVPQEHHSMTGQAYKKSLKTLIEALEKAAPAAAKPQATGTQATFSLKNGPDTIIP